MRKTTIDNTMAERKHSQQQVELARRAAQGHRESQRAVNEIAHPLIEFQTDRFCKRFCRENQRLYRCSLRKPIGSAPADAASCEWGNASYGWMLDDLCKAERLQKYEGRNQASLFDYLPKSALYIVPTELDHHLETFEQEVADRYEQRRHDIERPVLAGCSRLSTVLPTNSPASSCGTGGLNRNPCTSL